MAPSADDLPGRTPPEPKPKRGGGRKPGGQPGAPGSHLAWSADPDDRVPYFPEGSCACGAALAEAADLGVAASHQQVDIPLAAAQVIQHDLHEVACRCGRVHRAPAPAGTGAAGTVTYGLNLQAWCVYLMAAHAIPVHRCAELIESLTGARPSAGFVHSMLRRAAAARAMRGQVARDLLGQKRTSGGSLDTAVRAWQANPTGSLLSSAVMTLTAVQKWPNTCRNWCCGWPDSSGMASCVAVIEASLSRGGRYLEDK